MNRTFKSIWNESTGTFVAVAENTTNKGKKSSSRLTISGGLGKLVGSIALAASVSGVPLAVHAATGIAGGAGDGTAISKTSTECGSGVSPANAGLANSIAVGCGSVADLSTGNNTTFFNRGNPENNNIDTAGFYNSIAIGANAKAYEAGTSLGHGAQSGELGVAFGAQSKSTNVAAVAIGPTALATGNTALALGRQTAATADFAQAIGNVAIAKGKGSLAVGHSATATGNRSIAIGSADIDNAGSTGEQAGVKYQTAQQTLSTGKDSIALGAAAKSTSDYALAIGASSKAAGKDSTAIGFNSSATGIDSFAMGAQSKALAKNALALGGSAEANQENSIAVGVGAKANFINSVALGAGSQVLHNNSAAIGDGSTTNAYNQTAFLYSSGAAGAAATGAVSVGKGTGTATASSNERRLQNVAAGALDTDGVNVSQLKLHKIITDLTGNNIANYFGGGATFNSVTGAITNPTYNINNVNYTNVGAALKATKTEVKAGTNVSSVSSSTGADGQSIYTVNAKGTTVTGGSAAVAVSSSSNATTNVTDYKVDLSATTKGSLVNADSAMQTVITQVDGVTAKTLSKTNNNANFITGKNILLTRETDGSIKVATKDDVDFNKVTAATSVTVGDSASTGQTIIDKNNGINTKLLNVAGGVFSVQTNANGRYVTVGPNTTINMGGNKVTNMAAGTALTDAVNLSQLNAAKTHYYSVKSTEQGTGSNYANDGATGTNSLAAGVGAKATDESAVAVGHNVAAKGKNSVAIGSGATAQYHGGIAIGGVATDTSTSTPSTQAAEAKGLDSIALGSGAIADASFGAGANGQAATAIGKTAKAVGPNALAVGANSDAKNGTAVGSGAIVRNGGLAVGMGADAGPGAGFFPTSNVALGDDSKVTGGGFNVALGAMAVAGNSDLTAQAYRPVAGNAVAGELATGEVSIGGVDPFDTDNMIYRRVTNLAAGAADTDAVNVSQLKAVQEFAGQGFNITADHTDLTDPLATEDNVNLGETVAYTSADGSIVTTVSDNKINFELNNELTVGGKDGKDGLIGVKGADGIIGVVINGVDGSIGLTGPAGTDGVNPTLTMRPEIKEGNVIDDVTEVTRLTYKDATGQSHTVATLEDDGLRFSGNDNSSTLNGYVTRKLNQSMQIFGGKTTAGTYSSANIHTVATQDGGIEIQLADSPKFGSVTINAGNTGKITGVTAGVADTDAVNVSQLTTGLAATKTHYYSVNDGGVVGGNYNNDGATGANALAAGVGASATDTSAVAVGHNVTAKGKNSVAIGSGATAQYHGGIAIGGVATDTSTSTPSTQAAEAKGLDSIALGSGAIADASFGVGANGQGATAIGKTAKAMGPNALAVGANSDAKNGTAVGSGAVVRNGGIAVGMGADAGPGTGFFPTSNVALGDDSKVTGGMFNVALGTMAVAGNSDLTAQAYRPVAGNAVAGEFATGEVSIGGVDPFDEDNMIYRRVTNLAAGAADTDAVNVSQLKAVQGFAGQGFNITADNSALAAGETVDNVKLGDTVKYTSADGSIVTTVADNEINFALGDNLNVGTPGVDGKDGFIGVNGKDGVAGVAINGANGSIGLTGADGANGTITVKNGTPGLNGLPGTTTTRIVYEGLEGPEEVATLNDGLKFAGNTGTTIAKKLNETLSIEGELADLADASGANLRVDSKDGKLNLVMAKNLTDLDSITLNNGGPIISGTGINMGSNVDANGYPINRITNLGKGIAGTDAVNLDQLNAVNDTANKGWNVQTDTVGGKSNVAPDGLVNINGDGKNISVTNVGNNLVVALGDDLNVGTPGVDGKDGFIGVNGKDGVAGVAINGANGSIGLTGADGTKGTITVKDGAPGVDGVDGITRIVIDDLEVATLEDGLKFAGNTGTTIAKKLNETLNIEGELADLADASGANLRVDSKDGKLNLVMAKNLTDLDSIALNNGGPIISGTGINMGSNVDANGYPINRITNLGKGIAGTDAVNLDQLNAVNETANKGWNVQTDTVGGKSNVAPDGLVNINGDGKNISVTNVGNNLVVALGDELNVGTPGVDGKDGFIGVNGKDGVAGVAINGANGSIGLTGADGANGTITVKNGTPGLNGLPGTTTTRIVYEGPEGPEEVATLNDGLKFAGNTGTTIAKKLNETLSIEGELADLADASGANLRVDSKDGKLNVVMAKNLTDLDTVLVGSDPSNQTFINGGAISSNTLNVGGGRFIVEGNNVSVALGTNVSMGGNQVHNVVAGTAGTDAVNLDQLNAVNETANKGWNITTNGDPLSKENVAPDATVDFNNTDGNIVIGQVGTNLEFNLNKDIDLGDDGSVTTGNSVLNNAGLAVDDGAGNSTKVTTGGVEIADAAGNTTSIEAGGLTVSDGTNTSTFGPTQIVAGGANEVTIDGVTGRINGLTNKTFDPLSFTSGQAATEDQLKSVSDVANAGWNVTTNGDPLSKENVAPDATVDFNNTDGNIVIGQAGTNLEFNLNKDIDLGATGSVTTGDTVMNNNGVTIAGGPSITKTGIDAANKKITSVAKGEISETSTDAINGSQLSDSNIRITKNEGDIINNAGDIKNIQNGKEGMFQVSQDYNAPKPKPTGTKSVAGGAGAIASGNNSTAIGNDAKATANNSTSLGNSASASHNNSVALGYGSTTTRDNSVSVGSIGNERQITNVARGEVSATSTDAINGSQLHDFGGVVNQYFNATNKRIDRVDNNARAGIAGAVAAGTLPQSSLPGKSMLTLGGATYRGETALAIGVSRLSDNSRTVIKINGTADSRGHTSIGVGAGWHW